jgi:hypothetical protein
VTTLQLKNTVRGTNHMSKIVAAEVDDDLHDDLKRYKDTHGLNQSEAIRQLVRAGLDAEAESGGLASALGIRN